MSKLTKPNYQLVAFAFMCLSINEIGSDEDVAYRFSDPDGTQSGKSGYSFGAVQFDIENNWTALDCLRACGFRPKDIDRLFEQRGDISDLNAKLLAASDVVDRFDLTHVRESLEHCIDILNDSDILVSDTETLFHILDYHNQLYMSKMGKLHRFLISLNNEGLAIMPSMILDFKLKETKWGREHPNDVMRRYNNIVDLSKKGLPKTQEA